MQWVGVVVLAATASDAFGALNLGRYVDANAPRLVVSFGDPGGPIPPLTPAPLGPAGTFFHGTTSTSFVENTSSGPGDSSASVSLTSPTPGSTAQTPIRYRFDSSITNYSGGSGYYNAAIDSGKWYFDVAAPAIYFRVDWTVLYVDYDVGFFNTYQEIDYEAWGAVGFQGPPPYVTTSVPRGSNVGDMNIEMGVEGFGLAPIYQNPRTAPGTYSGSISGVATGSPYFGFGFKAGFNKGQLSFGSGRLIVDVNVYADTAPLPAIPEPAGLAYVCGSAALCLVRRRR